jgi:hypothetical protein
VRQRVQLRSLLGEDHRRRARVTRCSRVFDAIAELAIAEFDARVLEAALTRGSRPVDGGD